MKRDRALLVAATFGAAACVDASIAVAQEANLALDEIVVYGGARDERSLLETPNAVTVVDEFEVERRQPFTYEELIGDVPGVTIGGGPRGISQEPNIRGFQDEQVVLRIDGARQNFNAGHRGRFFTDPEILNRIEVLRGGASTLYGSGALGGVILLETKDAADVVAPGNTWGGRVKAGFDSQGTGFVSAFTLAADAGDFDALGFFSHRPMFDDLTDGAGDDILNSELDSMSGMVKLGYEPGDDHRFEVSYQRYDDDGKTPPNANAASTPDTVVDRELEFQTARAEWTWNPADSRLLDLSTLVYFNSADLTEDRPTDGRHDTTEYTTYGFELVNRSELDLGLPVRLSYGIEGFQDEQEASRNGGPRSTAPNAEARYLSAFVQGDIELGHGFTLTPGLRFDRFELEPEGNFSDRTESEFSPKLALQWRPTDDLQLWVTASQSFRAPSLTELYNDGTHFSVAGFPLGPPGSPVFTGNNVFVATPDLKPERARQIEIGGRYHGRDLILDGDRLTFSANAYYAKVKNFIDQTVLFIDMSTFNPMTGTVNGTTQSSNVDAELWGFEAAVDYDTGGWFAGAGLTIPRGEAKDGEALGSIPQDRLTLRAGFRPIPEVTIGGRATLLAEQNDVPDGAEKEDSAAIFDVFATYVPQSGQFEGTIFAVGIDNITDQEYRIYPNGLNQPGIAFKASVAVEF